MSGSVSEQSRDQLRFVFEEGLFQWNHMETRVAGPDIDVFSHWLLFVKALDTTNLHMGVCILFAGHILAFLTRSLSSL